MNKEKLTRAGNQNTATGWEDVTDYLPRNLENSQDNEKRERSFEKIGEYTSKYFERNQDGSYNFLGISPDEEISDSFKRVAANKLFSEYSQAYGLNYGSEKYNEKREFIYENANKILKGEILGKIDFSLGKDKVLVEEYDIDGLHFRFFNMSGDSIGAFVKDQDGVIKTRAFRDSGSDHQLKSAPGMVGLRWVKGDERDPNSHYVQSGKVDRRVYEIFNDLNKKRTYSNEFEGSVMGFISGVVNSRHQVIRGTEAFEFSEKQHEFKDKRWNKLKEIITQDFRVFLKVKKYGREIEELKSLSEDEYTKWFDERFIRNKNIFDSMEKVGMVPDFNRKPDARYFKDNGNIRIEEFITSNKQGDNICWAMAFDHQNRIYIGDIFTPDVPVDSYGTPSEKTNMGMLIYKPEDYASQNRGLPDKYIKEYKSDENDYEDISAMLIALPPVQKYIKGLIERKRRKS